MYDRRNSLSQLVATDARANLGAVVYQTVIPRNVRVSEAPSFGRPALIYDLKCAGSQAYLSRAGGAGARGPRRRPRGRIRTGCWRDGELARLGTRPFGPVAGIWARRSGSRFGGGGSGFRDRTSAAQSGPTPSPLRSDRPRRTRDIDRRSGRAATHPGPARARSIRRVPDRRRRTPLARRAVGASALRTGDRARHRRRRGRHPGADRKPSTRGARPFGGGKRLRRSVRATWTRRRPRRRGRGQEFGLMSPTASGSCGCRSRFVSSWKRGSCPPATLARSPEPPIPRRWRPKSFAAASMYDRRRVWRVERERNAHESAKGARIRTPSLLNEILAKPRGSRSRSTIGVAPARCASLIVRWSSSTRSADGSAGNDRRLKVQDGAPARRSIATAARPSGRPAPRCVESLPPRRRLGRAPGRAPFVPTPAPGA